jgi:Uncharacterized conserved protein
MREQNEKRKRASFLRHSNFTPCSPTKNHRSGALNAKHRELLELQAEAQRRLAATRANFAEGMKAAKEVKRDLEWTQKRVT